MTTRSTLKPCHSANADLKEIRYNPNSYECSQCPQRQTCRTSAERRLAKQSANPPPRYTNHVSTSTPARTTNGYYSGGQANYNHGSVLLYDPSPEEDESAVTRALKNGMSAAGYGFFTEIADMFRKNKW